MGTQAQIAFYSSVALRAVSYVFLRWFPGPAAVPLSIYTLFVVYVPSFISGYFSEPKYDVVEDDVDVSVKEALVQDENEDGQDEQVVAEEIRIEETIVVKERSRPWVTLLAGSPSPSSPILSILTFLINAVLIAMTTDFLFRVRQYHPVEDLSFVRLGYVSPSEAKFVLREPDQAKMPVTIEIHIKDPQPPFDNPLWQIGGGLRYTDNTTDFTATLTVPLKHSQQRIYEWRTSNNHSGEFVAPPKPGQMSAFADNKFTFLSTSCILPRFPYNPLEHPLAIPGMRHLANILPKLQAQFMLFLGDFIYIDVPKRQGKHEEDYRQKYRHVYASPDWAPVGQNLSWIHVLDDHEIGNDWDLNTTGVYRAAIEPWHHYQELANPPPARVAGTTNLRREGATYFDFVQGPASFFLLDTRSYRSTNSLPFDHPEKTMLGAQQLEDFIDWLNRPEPKGVKWKIVASSIPLTKNWPVNTRDTWGGFLVERRKVLEAMWDAGARGVGVVVVSGDRHEFAATKFPPPAGGRWPETAAAYEFSCSPLNQFASPLPTYRQYDDEDVALKYVHSGNSKFGSLTIENLAEGAQSSLKYSLFVDGEETWNTMILAPPVIGGDTSSSFWSDGARPRCRNCEFRGDGRAWGVKVSFHPSRALTLSAEDEASLLDVEQQRRADNTEQADADEPHQFVDDTNDIVEFFQGDYVTPSSPISDVDDPVVIHEPESQTDAESHTIPFVESTTPDDQNLDQGSWKAAEEAPGLTAHAQQQILPLITADTGAHQAPALHAETVVSYTAPFSLGQAIFSDAAPLPDLDLPVSKTEQAHLMTAYLRETGTWCETTDSEKHFTVKSIHSMMESRAFMAAALALSSRQVDTLRGRQRQTALELYQYTIRLLIYQDPSEADTSILATCTLLCVYEMMASSVSEWRRHLNGCAGLLKSRNWKGCSKGIIKSCFWAFARIDIWAAFIIGQTTLLSTTCWVENDSIPAVSAAAAASGDIDDYCNLAILVFAKIINLIAHNPPSPRISAAHRVTMTEDLWKDLSIWWKFRPRDVCPLLREEPRGSGNPFPTVVFTTSAAICGNTFFHAGSILLHETGLVSSSSTEKELSDPIWHARELGGLSISNDSHANWVNHLQPLFIAGRALANTSRWGGRLLEAQPSDTYDDCFGDGEEYALEKLALLKQLAKIEKETGWKTSDRSAELRRLWGFA
ncbi:alkaline phosphatase family protein [Colletotrichum asianum]|uniref:Alkaline phosphatase family protein n=1 Tax=Colletotrichum asianum TaxID=702518 RepID=A0A8H3ZWB1_9PEZI|nr:alkaline phosphatase family protein [Colletotrichum asianum]